MKSKIFFLFAFLCLLGTRALATVTITPTSSTICAGSTTTLTGNSGDGTWASSNTAWATVTAVSGGGTATVTGVLTGSTAESVYIYYYPSSGGSARATVTIEPNTPINGTESVCNTFTTTLTDATTGGTWSSGNTAVATVGETTGVVSTVAVGMATISYTTSYGCISTAIVDVNAQPDAIGYSGMNPTCSSTANYQYTVTFTNSLSGGTWSASGLGGTIVSSTGVFTSEAYAAAPGLTTATIKYTIPSTGCFAQIIETVNFAPGDPPTPLYGTSRSICGLTGTLDLTDGTTGGVWSSGNTSVATINTSGVVSAVSAGAAVISYTNVYTLISCSTTTTVYVDPAITGDLNICLGSTTTLMDPSGAGTWSSSNTAVASISGSGSSVTVSGIALGSATISFNPGTSGCSGSTTVIVNANPVISGTESVCVAGNTTLDASISGGTWSSSNTAIATINTSGVVTGVAAGTCVISYITAAGCSATATITVTTCGCHSLFTCTENNVSTIAGVYTRTYSGGYSGDGGLATSAHLNLPMGICADTAGNIYIADTGNYVVRKIDKNGYISTFAGNGTQGSSGDGGLAIDAEFDNPIGVACDTFGNVFIADINNNRVRVVNAAGYISTLAGTGTFGYANDDGPATLAELANPINVATDGAGNVYIADYQNSAIRKVDRSGNITTVAGVLGHSIFNGDGIAATSAYLLRPTSVVVDKIGDIFIDDESDYRIREVNTSGIINTVAWNGVDTEGFYGDGGPADSALMREAYGLAVDTCGNLYISDRNNFAIRVVNTSGIISTFAGNPPYGSYYEGDGGPALDAQFNLLYSICLDRNGNLLICDAVDEVIREVSCIGSERHANPAATPTVAQVTGDLACFPNPNDGSFTLKGVFTSAASKQASIEVLDMLGKVIYTDVAAIENGGINKDITLGNDIANGVYLIRVVSDDASKVLRFSLSR